MISSSYRLRHLTTKKYLKVIEEKKEGEDKLTTTTTTTTTIGMYHVWWDVHMKVIFNLV